MRSSIIIPNYNGMKFLPLCLKALFSEIDLNIDEVIVVDNASVDDSVLYIHEHFPMIKLINMDENYGFAKAVNEGIREAQGEYIILLNNDTEVCVNWHYHLLKTISSNSSTFSVSSKMIQFHNKDKIDDAGDELTLFGWAYQRGHGDSIDKYDSNDLVFSACGGAAIYRKEVLDQIGYFDDYFFAYLEDVDLGYRATVHGYQNEYCSDAKVYHIGSASSGGGLSSFKIKLSARNNVFLIYKNMPFLQIVINLPFLIAGSLLKYYIYSKSGFGKDYLQGTLEGIRHTSKVKRNKFSWKKLRNYAVIEKRLITSTIKYLIWRLQ